MLQKEWGETNCEESDTPVCLTELIKIPKKFNFKILVPKIRIFRQVGSTITSYTSRGSEGPNTIYLCRESHEELVLPSYKKISYTPSF